MPARSAFDDGAKKLRTSYFVPRTYLKLWNKPEQK